MAYRALTSVAASNGDRLYRGQPSPLLLPSMLTGSIVAYGALASVAAIDATASTVAYRAIASVAIGDADRLYHSV